MNAWLSAPRMRRLTARLRADVGSGRGLARDREGQPGAAREVLLQVAAGFGQQTIDTPEPLVDVAGCWFVVGRLARRADVLPSAIHRQGLLAGDVLPVPDLNRGRGKDGAGRRLDGQCITSAPFELALLTSSGGQGESPDVDQVEGAGALQAQAPWRRGRRALTGRPRQTPRPRPGATVPNRRAWPVPGTPLLRAERLP